LILHTIFAQFNIRPQKRLAGWRPNLPLYLPVNGGAAHIARWEGLPATPLY
jgi:hypothetical protein